MHVCHRVLELTLLSVRIILLGPTVVAAVVAEHVQMAMHDDDHGIGVVLDPEALVVEAMLPGTSSRTLASPRTPLTVFPRVPHRMFSQ